MLRKLFHSKTNSRHVENIKTGNKLIIGGKEYVKVKLRFVDSLDSKGTALLENAEFETENLKEENKVLSEHLSKNEVKVSKLMMLNTNLLNNEKTESARLRNEVFVLRNQVDELIEKIEELNSKLEKKSSQYDKLNGRFSNLNKTLNNKTYECEKLEYQLSNFKLDNDAEKHIKENKNLNYKIEKQNSEINSLLNKLSQQEQMNKDLFEKLLMKRN